MSPLPFLNRLNQAWSTSDSLLCVGLDPLPERFPPAFARSPQGIFEFNKQIVKATADNSCAFKPQIAHYSAIGAENQLELTINWIKKHYPDHLVILDAKRGDIGSTSALYAKEVFERYAADAVTLNPYLGMEALKPFLDYADRGCFILCRTSNPGSLEFQLQGNPPLYLKIASKAKNQWNQNRNLGLVVGATWPEDLNKVREIAPDLPMLIPGIGTQKGDLKTTLRYGLNKQGTGLMINVTRALIYLSTENDFIDLVHQKAADLSRQINQLRQLSKNQKDKG